MTKLKHDVQFFARPIEFRKWLEQNHKTRSELFVGFYKKASKIQSITWSESVDQALCFGWIDGLRQTIDETSYCIRFTPRRKNSTWSLINIKKIETLSQANQMTEEGLLAFSLRKESKLNLYAQEQAHLQLSDDFKQQFKKNKKAWNYFTQQAPSYQKVTSHWIMSAKKEITKQTRLSKAINESEKQKRIY